MSTIGAPAVHIGDVDPSLDAPELTRDKLGRQFGRQIDWQHVQDTLSAPPVNDTVPGMDVAAVQRRVDPAATAYRPRRHIGSFSVPYGMRGPSLDALKREKVTQYVATMDKMGFDLVRSGRITIVDGPNPSIDPTTGLVRPGHRDFLIGAYFAPKVGHAETVRIELDDDMLAPVRLTQRPTSPG
jgi:hypothetical protein